MMATAVILFFSCSNDFENVIKVSEFEKLPELTGDNKINVSDIMAIVNIILKQ